MSDMMVWVGCVAGAVALLGLLMLAVACVSMSKQLDTLEELVDQLRPLEAGDRLVFEAKGSIVNPPGAPAEMRVMRYGVPVPPAEMRWHHMSWPADVGASDAEVDFPEVPKEAQP